jgi:hypothetical protein
MDWMDEMDVSWTWTVSLFPGGVHIVRFVYHLSPGPSNPSRRPRKPVNFGPSGIWIIQSISVKRFSR